MKKMTIGEKLKFHRKRLGITLNQLSEKTVINNGNLSKMENGKQGVTDDNKMKIAAVFGMELVDLIQDLDIDENGNVQQAAPYSRNGSNGTNFVRSARHIKDFSATGNIKFGENVIIDRISPDNNSEKKWIADESNQFTFNGDIVRKINSSTNNLYGFEVPDEAMNPRMYKTDLVLIDVGDTELTASGGVYAVFMSETIQIRRLFLRVDGGIKVGCDNPAYPSETLSSDQRGLIKVIGRIKAMTSNSGF